MITDRTKAFTASEMYAVWVTYNTEGAVFCPVCGTALNIEAEQPVDVSKDGTAFNIRVRCLSCGRTGKHASR